MDKQHGEIVSRTDFLRMILKNIKLEHAIPWWNTRILVQENHNHSWQTSTRNEQLSVRSSGTRMDNQRKNLIDPKIPTKGTAPNIYRPITCLPMMWKMLTVHIKEAIYFSLTSRGLFPEELKGCQKGSRSTGELLYIDKHILHESKTRRKI